MAGQVTKITGSGHIVFHVYGNDNGNPWRVLPGWRRNKSKQWLFTDTDPGKPWVPLLSNYLLHGSINKYMIYVAGMILNEDNEIGTMFKDT